jgi:hypothetical protein
MVMMDMDGFPVSTTPPAAPSQEAANTFGPPAPSQEAANTFGPPAPVNTAASYNPGYGQQNMGVPKGNPGRRGLPTTQEEAIRAQELAQFNVPGGVTIPATKPAAPQREMDNWGQGSMPNNSGGMQNANQNPGTATPATPPATPPVTPQSSPSTASNPILDQLRKTWKDLGTPRYSPVPQSTSPGVDATEPQSMGLDLGDMAPGQPYVVPGSQDWNNMSQEDQENMVTRALKNKEVHKFTGGRDAVDPNSPDGERMRFNTDNGSDSFAADTNQRSKLANDVIDRQRQNANREMMDLWNRSDLDDEKSGRPWFWPKVSTTSETPKPAEDTRPTSGRQSTYPGSKSTSGEPSLQDMLNTMIDRMKNNSNLPRPTFRPRFRPRSK